MKQTLERLDNGAQRHPDDPGEPLTGKPRISVTEEEGQFLRVLARDKVVLEIGTGLGVSTTFLAKHARAVVSIDTDPWVKANVWPHFGRRANVKFLDHRSKVERDVYFDMVFIDGHHTYEDTYDDVTFAFEHITTNGIVVVHDALDKENVSDALGRHWYRIPTTYGLALRSAAYT